ncbi:Protein YdeP [Eumeta japonica]|uniref:Protein YdeP n=1 Tax=Eumeta variegata TaxID=151549 RepID=A0A4C1SNC7_EUMVA|nr:Protein YdeP [Eumeta japonica]
MKEQNRTNGIAPYGGAAGGWGALKAVADAIRGQMSVKQDVIALFKVNQPQGFDCPGCAWPDPQHASSFEFCENGAKAVSWEATSKRTTPEFFAAHTVTELWEHSALHLEGEGRLTHPMKYDPTTDTYQPIEWETAFQEIGEHLCVAMRIPIAWSFIRRAAPQMKRRFCGSSSPANMAPTISPTAQTCVATDQRRTAGSMASAKVQ